MERFICNKWKQYVKKDIHSKNKNNTEYRFSTEKWKLYWLRDAWDINKKYVVVQKIYVKQINTIFERFLSIPNKKYEMLKTTRIQIKNIYREEYISGK